MSRSEDKVISRRSHYRSFICLLEKHVDVQENTCLPDFNSTFDDLTHVALNLLDSINFTTMFGIIPLVQNAVKTNSKVIVESILDLAAGIEEVKEFEINWALYFAIENEAVDIVQLLIERGADVNIQDDEENTPLHMAVANANVQAVQMLLSADVDTTVTNCIKNEAIAIVQLLIEGGANINIHNYKGDTPLHMAVGNANVQAVQMLLSADVDTKVTNSIGMTALHTLARNIRKKSLKSFISVFKNNVVQWLLQKGAHIDAQDDCNKTVLHYAVENEDVNLVEILLNLGADVNVRDAMGETALHKAVYIYKDVHNWDGNENDMLECSEDDHSCDENENCMLECLKMTLNKVDDVNCPDFTGATPLHLAVTYRNTAAVALLLSRGADPSSRDNKGQTGIHYLAKTPSEEILDLLLRKKELVDSENESNSGVFNPLKQRKNVDVNSQDKEGNTPLHIAVELNYNSKMVKTLLSCGADINIQNKKGDSALHIATYFSNVEIMEILLCGGLSEEVHLTELKGVADVNIQNNRGETALHNAKNVSVLSLLFKYHSYLGLKDECGRTAMHKAASSRASDVVETLIKLGAEVDVRDYYGCTPLMLACFHQNVMEVLLDAGADLHCKDADGQTVLFYSSSQGIIEYLIDRGAEVDVQDKNGQTPLHVALVNCKVGAVGALILAGARVDLEDGFGVTALDRLKHRLFIEVSLANLRHCFSLFLAKCVAANIKTTVTDQFDYWAYSNFDKFYGIALNEVDRIRHTSMEGVSLYSILHYSLDNLGFVTKYELKKQMQTKEFQIEFPYYSLILKTNFKEAEIAYALLEILSEIFSSLVSINWNLCFPTEVGHIILQKLSFTELLNLNSALN